MRKCRTAPTSRKLPLASTLLAAIKRGRPVCGRLIVGVAMTAIGGGVGVGCQRSQSALPMLPDGKEAIYSLLSQGNQHMADEALADTWDIGPRAARIKLSPITWNDDPYDKYWRFIFYGLRPLSNLLHAFYTTGNVAYRDKLLDVIRSYNAFEVERGDAVHPFLDDPHTACFRAMMLVNIYGKLSRTGDLPEDVAAGMRASIEKVAAFLALDADFQDGENHGFKEAAALLVAAVNFPEMPSSALWKATALSRLQKLSVETIDSDGVEIENSPFYQFYVLSFLQQDSKWMSANAIAKPDGFDAKIANMFEYATYGTQPDGFVPLLGASVTLNVHKLLPNVYEKDSLDGAEGLEDVTPAFTFVRELGAAGTAPTIRNRRFATSGQSFLRSSFGTKEDFRDQTWISFNAGNYRSSHNHFDALGLTYYASGKPLLPDAGLYEYEGATPQPLPTYFKSTRAHNTVVVDGADQPSPSEPRVIGGVVVEGGEWMYQSARHTLYDGVTHRRSIVLLKRDVTVVLDSLESIDVHDYVQTWHFEPQATLKVDGLDIVAAGADGQSELSMHQAIADGITLSLSKGQEGPTVQGFYSDKYDTKVANYAAEYRRYATEAGFATLLASGKYATTATTFRATYDRLTGTVAATICLGDVKTDVRVVNQAADGERVIVEASQACP